MSVYKFMADGYNNIFYYRLLCIFV